MNDNSETISATSPVQEPIGEATDQPDEIERVVGDLIELGRSWASHGLTVGKLALQQSAHSLEVTASMLGNISERLRRD